jgi:hypothetical protein
MTPPETNTPTSRARISWKWVRRIFGIVSLGFAITYLLTLNPVPAAQWAAVEKGHNAARLTTRGFDSTNARWLGGSTTVRLRSEDGNGAKDIDVVLKRPPWLFGWQVVEYTERAADK